MAVVGNPRIKLSTVKRMTLPCLAAAFNLSPAHVAFAQKLPPDAGDLRYVWSEYVTSEFIEATITGNVSESTVSLSSRNSAFSSVTKKVRNLLEARDSLESTLLPFVRRSLNSII